MQPNDNDFIYNSYGVDFTPLLRGIYELFSGGGGDFSGFVEVLQGIWFWYSVIAFILSMLFIYGIIYSYLRINEYGAKTSAYLEAQHQAWLELNGRASTENTRWAEIQRHITSGQPNDWKLAIIEADIILGEGLDARGYAGRSIGEQLKSVPQSQLSTLRDAWDAHMVRNKIAHQGADFVLTQGMAREAMVKYERVFRELGVI